MSEMHSIPSLCCSFKLVANGETIVFVKAYTCNILRFDLVSRRVLLHHNNMPLRPQNIGVCRRVQAIQMMVQASPVVYVVLLWQRVVMCKLPTQNTS